MRFDLEIQQDLLKLTYVEAGNTIDSSMVPILYMHTKDVNLVPKDFITIDTSTRINQIKESPIFMTQFIDGKFTSNSDKVLLTHIALYSKITNTKFPVFYNHSIKLSDYLTSGGKFNSQSVVISTVDGITLDSSLYTIEHDSEYAHIYVNPIDNAILQIQWSDSNKIFKEMLKLKPVYQDMGNNFNADILSKYQYCCNLNSDRSTFTVHLGRTNGTIYYKLKNDASIVHPPICNMDDEWNLLFENILLYSTDKDSIQCSYRLPEYYLQKQFDAINDPEFNGLFKKYANQIAKIYNKSYIKTQVPPAVSHIGMVDIVLYNKINNEIALAYTTDSLKVNTIHELNMSIVWKKVTDYNLDGLFYIDSEVNVDDVYARATYVVDNNFYQFKYIDIKNTSLDATRMLAIYIAPTYNYNDADTFKMYYVYIGSNMDTSIDKQKVMGACFSTKDDYMDFIQDNSNMHVCFVSINTSKLLDTLEISECSSTNIDDPLLTSDESITYSTALLSKHIINNNMRLPLDDTIYINIDQSLFKNSSTTPDADEEEFLNFVHKTVYENITISTNSLYGKNKINSKMLPYDINLPSIETTTTTEFIGTITPADPIIKIISTTTTTTEDPNAQRPFTWVDVTNIEAWNNNIDYEYLWNGSGWNSIVVNEGEYSYIFLEANIYNMGLQYLPEKIRITFSGLDKEHATFYIQDVYSQYVYIGEDGDDEPYEFESGTELTINVSSNTIAPFIDYLGIYSFNGATFTIDKIEIYLSDIEMPQNKPTFRKVTLDISSLPPSSIDIIQTAEGYQDYQYNAFRMNMYYNIGYRIVDAKIVDSNDSSLFTNLNVYDTVNQNIIENKIEFIGNLGDSSRSDLFMLEFPSDGNNFNIELTFEEI